MEPCNCGRSAFAYCERCGQAKCNMHLKPVTTTYPDGEPHSLASRTDLVCSECRASEAEAARKRREAEGPGCGDSVVNAFWLVVAAVVIMVIASLCGWSPD